MLFFYRFFDLTQLFLYKFITYQKICEYFWKFLNMRKWVNCKLITLLNHPIAFCTKYSRNSDTWRLSEYNNWGTNYKIPAPPLPSPICKKSVLKIWLKTTFFRHFERNQKLWALILEIWDFGALIWQISPPPH